MTPVYSDFYIDRWADVFVRWQFNRRLGIDLIDFLEAPERYLRQVPSHPLPKVNCHEAH